MKKRAVTIVAPGSIASMILSNQAAVDELRDTVGNYSVGWSKDMVFDVEDGTILISFIPKGDIPLMHDFFKQAATNPMHFVFTEERVYGRRNRKMKTPGGHNTFEVISRRDLTAKRIIETIQLMRTEFP